MGRDDNRRRCADSEEDDFDKPVTLWVNSSQLGAPREVKPSLAVLMEDLYRRGDRQRLYLARIDLTLSKK